MVTVGPALRICRPPALERREAIDEESFSFRRRHRGRAGVGGLRAPGKLLNVRAGQALSGPEWERTAIYLDPRRPDQLPGAHGGQRLAPHVDPRLREGASALRSLPARLLSRPRRRRRSR